MLSCEIPSLGMFETDVVHLDIDEARCDLECAREAAIQKATAYDNSPQLISWFDKRSQSYFPSDECCVEGEPSWLAYGLAHGADLTVDVNDEDYVFMFRKSHGLP